MSYIGKQPIRTALTSSDIEDGIITAAKIEDGAVVAAEIASNAVTTAKINADAVTGAKIADDAVNSEHYTDGSIDTAHIADGQITTAKLATAVFTGATDIGAAIADADLFLMDDGAGGTIRKTAASRIKTYAGGLTGVSTGSGNVTITDGDLIFGGAGHGVYLGVTSATAANHLDDYEEGSFTPAYGFDSGSVGMNSGSRGDYVKIGNLVHFQIYMSTDSTSSPSGDTSITGLPFTTGDNSSSTATIGLMYRFETDFDGDTKARIEQNNTVINLFKNASSSTSSTRIQGSDLKAGSNTAWNNLHVAGCYSTA